MASTRLKMLTWGVHITVSVMTMVLMLRNMNAWGLVLHDRSSNFWSWSRGWATERSLTDNLTRWIIPQSKGFTRNGIEQISRSVRAYVYLVLTSQVQARSSMVGNSTAAVDAQKMFKGTFNELINEDYSIGIDIARYQRLREHQLSNANFSVGIGIYMLPINLNLNIG